MLIYPPGRAYQRGEDRCQIDIEASVSNSFRACNDLGVIAAIIKKKYNVFLKDYPAEKLSFADFITDIKNYKPDVVFMSITNGSIYSDLKTVEKIKSVNPDTIIILKGALFFNPEYELYNENNFSLVDYTIGSESDFSMPKLLDAHFFDKEKLKEIQGISYKENNAWKINKIEKFEENLDILPFPDRSLMKNELYVNPATNKPMATIVISRGCPFSCIYCVSPFISGKKVRFRTVENVFAEIKECSEKYGINDFFFRSDTFTFNNDYVSELCNLIINSELKNKINWVANSRADTINEKTILKMKEAGCSVIAVGFESGSEESLKLMKKGTTLEQNANAAHLIKKNGIKLYGFYLIGLPWETEAHLRETEQFIFKTDADFIEISVATPFKGSELYNMVCEKNGKIVQGKDSFRNFTSGSDYLSVDYIRNFRNRIILKYHIRTSYILKKLFDKNLTFEVLFNYIKYALRLIKNCCKGKS